MFSIKTNCVNKNSNFYDKIIGESFILGFLKLANAEHIKIETLKLKQNKYMSSHMFGPAVNGRDKQRYQSKLPLSIAINTSQLN